MRPAIQSLACLLALTGVAAAQAPVVSPAPTTSGGVATYDMENFSGGVGLNGASFDFRYQSSNGVGYQNGYSQFGLFAPFWLGENSFVGPNARLILTDDNTTGLNAGFLARHYHSSWDRIFGVNGYYDLDESQSGNTYEQIGFGFETLGRNLDFRLNGYWPLSDQSYFLRPTGLTNQMLFFEHRLGFLGTELAEKPLTGGDFEFGIPLISALPWLRGYAGMYYYDRSVDALDGDDIVGVRGRIEGYLSSDLSVGVMVTSDSVYNTNVNAIVDWRFSGFKPTRFLPNFQTNERMTQPVQRHWRITVDQYQRLAVVQAYNPRDDQPYFVVWVDNSNPQPGDGTYENPYSSVPGAVPNETDLVLVRRGNTTAAAPLSGTFTLPDYARMLGEGYEHVLDAYANFGPFSVSVDDAPLPDSAFTNTGLYPFLTAGANIVQVNNHNEVAAFVLENAGGAAIAGTNTFGFHFHHLEVTNNAGGGIVLNGANGVGNVTVDGQVIDAGLITDINRNTVVGWTNPTGQGGNGGPGGIVIGTDLLPLNLGISRTTMNASAGNQAYGIRLTTGVGQMNAGLLDVSTSGGNAIAGISLEQGVGDLVATLIDVTASDNLGRGIQGIGGTGLLDISGDNVQANNNVGDNMNITLLPTSTFTGTFSNSSFSNSTTGHGIYYSQSANTNSLTLSNVLAGGNALSGVDLQVTGGTLDFTATSLFANSNGSSNLNIFNDAATVNASLTMSEFNSSVAGDGIRLVSQNAGTNVFSLINVTAGSNAESGIDLRLFGSSSLGLVGSAVIANGNAADNFYLANDASTANVQLMTSEFDGSTAGSGFVAQTTSAGTTILQLNTVSASNNAAQGIRLDTTGAGSSVALTGTLVDASSNVSDNLQINNTDSTFAVNLASSLFNGSTTGSGIVLSADNSTGAMNLASISASSNAVHGLQVTAVNGSVIGDSLNPLFDGVNVVNSTLTGNGVDAINTFQDGGSYLELFVDPTNLSSSGRHGFRFEVLNGSQLVTRLEDVNLNNSGSNPLVLETSAVGGLGRAIFGLVDGFNGGGPSMAAVAVVNATMNNAGDDGIFLQGSNTAVAVMGVSGGSEILDAGQNIAGASAAEIRALSGATVSLSMLGVPGDNTVAGGPADYGLSVLADGVGSTATATVTSGSFNNTGISGVNGVASNSGLANIFLTTVTANDAGSHGVSAEANTSGLIYLEFDEVTATGAGGDGLHGVASTAGTFYACILNSTFDANDLNGIGFDFSGTGTLASIHIEDTSASMNVQNGLYALVSDEAEMNLRTVGSNFDDNGTLMALDYDGVFVRAEDQNSIARLLFSNTTADRNSRDGFHFEADDAVINARIDNVSGQDNGRYGLFFSATGANSAGLLIPSGANDFSGNGTAPMFIDFSMSGVAIIGLTGSFNGMAGDGVQVNISNVTTALVTVTGNGTDTIDGNGGDGIDIRISDADYAGIRVAGYQSISNNVEDGVHIELTNIAMAAAVDLLGPTDLIDNGGDGVDVALNNVVLGLFDPNLALMGLNEVLTLTDNLPSPYDCLPLPTTVPFDQLFPLPTSNGILVDSYNIQRTGGAPAAGQDGIRVTGTTVTGTGDIALTNNTVDNYDTGISLDFTGSSFGDIRLENNTVSNSALTSIDISYTGGSLNAVVVNGQGTATVVGSAGNGINLLLTGVGGTPTIEVSNYALIDQSGGNGVSVVATGTNLSSVTLQNLTINNSGGDGLYLELNGMVGDGTPGNSSNDILAENLTVNNSGGDGWEFNLDGISGSPDIKITDPTFGMAGGMGFNFHSIGGALGAVDMDPLVFNGTYGSHGLGILIQNTSLFSGITIDQISVTGAALDGINVLYDTVAGDPSFSIFNPSSITNSGVNGLTISYVNTLAASSDLSISDLTVTDSGVHGIQILQDAASSLRDVSVNNSSVTNSTTGDGIQIALNGLVNSVLVDGSTVDGSGLRGINIDLTNVAGSGMNAPDITVSNTDVSNSGTDGVAIHGTGNTLRNVLVDTVSSDTTGTGDGIVVGTLMGSTIETARILNSSAANSAGYGILLSLDTVTGLTNAEIAGPGTVDTSGLDGIRLELMTVSGVPTVSVTDMTVRNSTDVGIHVLNNFVSISDITISNNTVDQSGDQGILANLSGSSGAVTADGNTVSNSGSNGVELFLNSLNTGGADVTVSNSTISDSTGHGLLINSFVGSYGNIIVDTADVSNSTAGNGILVLSIADTLSDSVQIHDAIVSGSSANGIFADLRFTTGLNTVLIDSPNLAQGTVSNSGLDGIRVELTTIFGNTPNITVDGYDVSTSGDHGIHILNNGSAVDAVTVSNSNVDISGLDGIDITLTGNIGSVLVDTVSSANSTGGNGVLLDLSSGAITGDVRVRDAVVSNSDANGIYVDLVNISIGGDVFVDVSAPGLGSVTNSANGDGILVELNTVTGTPNITVDGYDVSFSGVNGISVLNNGSDVGAVQVSNSSVDTSTAGDGIHVVLTGNVGTVLVDTVNVSNSNGGNGILVDVSNGTLNDFVRIRDAVVDTSFSNGIHVDLNTLTGLADVFVDTSGPGLGSVSNSGADGILVELVAVTAPAPNVLIDGYDVDNSANRGIALLTNGLAMGDVQVSNSNVSNSNAGQGVLIDLNSGVGHNVGSVTVTGLTVDNSFTNGIEVGLDFVTGMPTITVMDSDVTNSQTGFGIYVYANNADLGDVIFDPISVDSSFLADGVRLELTNTTVNDSNGDTFADILFDRVSSTNNGGNGVGVFLTNVSSSAAAANRRLRFLGEPVAAEGDVPTTTVSGNGADGIAVLLNASSFAPLVEFSDMDVSGNGTGGGGNGIVLNQVASNVTTVDFNRNLIDGNATHGVEFLVTNSTQGTVQFLANQISDNGTAGVGDGVRMVQPDDTDGITAMNFTRNLISGNQGHGINITLPFDSAVSRNGTLNLNMTNDSVNSNGGAGVNVALNGTTAAGNTRNVTANISIQSNSTANAFTGLDHAEFNGNGAVSGDGMGVYLRADDTSDILLTIGGTGTASTFNGNRDAGVGIELSGSATATAQVANASFNSNLNGSNTNFFGDGFGVSLINNSTFTNSTFGNGIVNNTTFDGNAGSGLFVDAGNNFAIANNILVQNSTFTNNAGLSTGSGGGGITFHRNSSGSITNVTITGNTISTNRNGIDIEARSANLTDTYQITNNFISGNNGPGATGGHGVRFFVEFDADIATFGAGIDGNTITNNRVDGINVQENAATTDSRLFTATINNNLVDNNGNDGIEVSTIYDISADTNTVTNNGANGFNLNGSGTSVIQQSVIDDNGLAGIRITGQFNTTIQLNDVTHNGSIANNGTQGIELFHQAASSSATILTNDILFNGNDGIQLDSTPGNLTALVQNNLIFMNSGDGIQAFMHGGGSASINNNPNSITIGGLAAGQENLISNSGRRGINVVNAAVNRNNSVRTTLNIDGNDILFSQLEGIYIVNTTQEAQGTGGNIDNLASAAMIIGTAADAENDPRLALNVRSNTLQANGQNGSTASFIGSGIQTATGLVLRVSTSDANSLANDGAANSYQDNGGFASDGTTTSASLAAGATIGSMARGGVQANIASNNFVGQFGADVTFQGYRSIESLIASAGTWNDNNDNPRNNANDVFNITTFLQDPLARLDLHFLNNSGDGLIATRSDAGDLFFNNAEAVFKSRTLNQDGNDPPGNPGNIGDDGGPFTNASRLRNATRLADSSGAFNRPTGIGTIVDVSANGFLYPGTDTTDGSTFRITTGTSTLGFPSLMANPTQTFFTGPTGTVGLNGITGGGGELPFIWGTLP